MTHEPTARPTVAWIAPETAEARVDERAMRAAGFDVISCVPGGAASVLSDLRVLHARGFASQEALRDGYLADVRPTLVVVDSATDEEGVLAFLRIGDEIARGDASTESTGRRLVRLMRRANDARELALLREHMDPLTQLPNRKRYIHEVGELVDRHVPGVSVGLLLLDLDRFKYFNDRFGEDAGDRALVRIAGRLRRAAQDGDTLYRLDSEEFTVVIKRRDRASVIASAEALQRAAGEPDAQTDGGPAVTASAGLVFVDSNDGLKKYWHDAYEAMYMAKIAGRNQLVLHEDVEALAELHGTTLELADLSGLAEAAKDRLVSMAGAMNQKMLEEAQRDANQDALTRIHNRRYFDTRISRELDLARRQGTPLSVALIDIDDFRLVNNTYGHPTGDLVLRGFADLAAQSIRSVDWIARYGGEEFCLVMPATLDEAGQVAERIRARAMQASMRAIDGRAVAFTVSIGVVRFTPDLDSDPVQLMHRASKAERQAKDAGKNRVIVSGA